MGPESITDTTKRIAVWISLEILLFRWMLSRGYLIVVPQLKNKSRETSEVIIGITMSKSIGKTGELPI